MNDPHIDQLFKYPVKSTMGITLNAVNIERTGFEHDREFVIVDAANTVITAREKSVILRLKSGFNGTKLTLSAPNKNSISVDIEKVNTTNVELVLFDLAVSAQRIEHPINNWLSIYFDEPCYLARVDQQHLRLMKPTETTTEDNPLFFTDSCPIHLVNLSSLEKLNKTLEKRVKMSRFRPNIIVSGVEAFEEEKWRYLKIGNCEFEVVKKTKRCKIITIDPQTAEVSKKQEPLRSLAQLMKNKGEANFGIYLLPLNTGKISITDSITVQNEKL